MLRYQAKRKAGEIPAILIGLLTAVFVTVEPLTQGKSWGEITHLSWGTILPPVVVGFISHYLTVPRQEMSDVNQAYTAYIDHLRQPEVSGAGVDSFPVVLSTTVLPAPQAVTHAEWLESMISP
jgi:hypothetical protein